MTSSKPTKVGSFHSQEKEKKMACINCNSENASHIADGLYLCSRCEKNGKWHLFQDIETKELRWKDILHHAIVDEVQVD